MTTTEKSACTWTDSPLTKKKNISGMNQLLWYYSDLEKQECLKDEEQRRNGNETIMHAVSSRKGSKVSSL